MFLEIFEMTLYQEVVDGPEISSDSLMCGVASKLSSLVIEFSIGCQDVENLRMSDVNLGRRDRRRRLVRSISSAMSIPPPTSRMRDARDFGISYAAPLPTRSTMQVNVNNENIDEEQLLTSINPVDVMNSVSPQVVSRLSDKTMLQISKASLQSILSADTRQIILSVSVS